ncbi:MAG TPA: hypothetical protein VG733_00315 [Chthoniobacteraceae bacterium]|nr:hypothetical protein [Chthoniobacteraceae bacterium]
MGVLDFFRKPKAKAASAGAAYPKELPSISYAIAYFVLPNGIYREAEKLISAWTDPAGAGGAVLYHMGCRFKGVEAVAAHGALFHTFCGQLDDATDYYLLEYPTPPPLDFSKLFPGKNVAEAEVPVLAPWFSAILVSRETGALSYYVLGQSPVGGGTTLRSVAADGVNGNLGPGPAPRRETFLAALRALLHPAT